MTIRKNKSPAPPQQLKTADPNHPVRAPRPPWRVTLSECDGVYGGNPHFALIEDFPDGKILADIEEWVDRRTAETLAAAPALFKALCDVKESLDDFYRIDPAAAGQHFGATLRERIDAAIAKARPGDRSIPIGTCKTCGRSMHTVLDSSFDDGECDACERRRYETQPELLKLAKTFRLTCEGRIGLLKDDEPWRPDDEREDMIGHYTALLNDCKRVIAKAYGHAA